MADGILTDQGTVRQRALVLLSVADCVKQEGWGDAVAAQLRQAAEDLLGIASDTVPTKEATGLPNAW
jgi:hypothetical protein